MKSIVTSIILLIVATTQAQWEGTFTTKFGTVKLVQEQGSHNNGFETLVYGDYGQNGTIIGTSQNNGRELHGSFHNGSQSGKFVWIKSGLGSNPVTINPFTGNWGYGTQNNLHSSNPDHAWTGNRTTTSKPNDLVNNLWSGKWNTNFGELILEQVGTKVNGKYFHGNKVSIIDANFNKYSKILVGTFTENNKKGYFQFNLNGDGNSFSGKWGWTSLMNESSPWNGTKIVKTNKATGTTTTNTTQTNTATTQNTATTTQNNTNTATSQQTKVKVWFKQLSSSDGDVYGIWGVKLFKVTQNSRVIVNSFGNKNDVVYNFNRNSSRVIKAKSHQFSNSPDNFREYIISNAELNNPNIKFEIEIIAHPKSKKTVGSDLDYGRQKKVIELKNLPNNSDQLVDCGVQGSTIFGTGLATFTVAISKTPHP